MAPVEEVQLLKVFEKYESTITGTISKIAVHKTKKGEEMTFVSLEEHSDIQTIVLPGEYAEYRALLIVGRIVECIGSFAPGYNDDGEREFFPMEIRTISTTASGTE